MLFTKLQCTKISYANIILYLKYDYSLFSSKGKYVDMHPERRLKAAFAEFEVNNLERLKKENPTLRLSQIKQILRKEWMKSPNNPLNNL